MADNIHCLNLFPAKRNLKEIIKVAVKAFFFPTVTLWCEVWGSQLSFRFCEQPFQSRFIRWCRGSWGTLYTCSSTSLRCPRINSHPMWWLIHSCTQTYTHTSSHFFLFHLLLLWSRVPLKLMRILPGKIRSIGFCKDVEYQAPRHRVSELWWWTKVSNFLMWTEKEQSSS